MQLEHTQIVKGLSLSQEQAILGSLGAFHLPKDLRLEAHMNQIRTEEFKVGKENRVIVFNVPFPKIYHFPNFSKICGVTPLVDHHSFYVNLSLCHLFGTLSYSTFFNFLSFLMMIFEAKIFQKKKNLFISF